jgi:hypothetical protein
MRWELFASHIAELPVGMPSQVALPGDSVQVTSTLYWIAVLVTAALDWSLVILLAAAISKRKGAKLAGR